MKRVIVILSIISSMIFVALFVYSYNTLNKNNILSLTNDDIKKIITNKIEQNTSVYDRSGKKIGEFFSNYSIQLSYDDIPPFLIQAIISTEDKKFYTHSGLDYKAILRAFKNMILTRSFHQGASTITQQIVKNLILTHKRTIERKIIEAYLSIKLEKMFSKKEIFEFYANNMFLGNGSYGVAAAARRYFNKDIHELLPEQMALIAGLFQSPSKYNPFKHPDLAKQRQKIVLTGMYENGFINDEEYFALLNRDLNYAPYTSINNTIAPYFLDYIKEEVTDILKQKPDGKGYRIYTTLDLDRQIKAQQSIDSLSGIVSNLIKDEKLAQKYLSLMEASLISIDPKTGAILTMIGGRDFSKSQFNTTTSSLRSLGSLFKPVVYTLALLQGKKWSDLMFISPISVAGYRPKNVNSSFLKEATMMKAFYSSLNTSAVELGTSLGLDEVISFAERLGIRTPLKHEYGTFIGSSDVSFFDILRLYEVYANQGVINEIYAIEKILDSSGKVVYDIASDSKRNVATEVLDKDTAFLLQEGLKNVVRYGTARKLADFSGYVAGKTGTTNDSKDNWFCGYTNDTLSLVWVGSNENLPPSISGSSIAIPIWRSFMEDSIKTKISTPISSNLISYRINPVYGNISDQGIKMYFKKDNEPDTRKSSYEIIENYSGKYRGMFEDL